MSVVLGPAILLSPWYASLPMRGWAGTSHGHYFLVACIWLPHFWNTSDGSLVSTGLARPGIWLQWGTMGTAGGDGACL